MSFGRRKISVPDIDSSPAQKEQEATEHSKLSQIIIDFEVDLMNDGTKIEELLKDVDVVFCTLGTTRKAAGSAERFKRVDYDYVAKIADVAKAAGVKHFSLLTSIGANPKSPFLYMQTKGRIEEYVKAKGFPRVSLFRPSLLIASRQESRPGERIAQIVYPWFSWMLFGSAKRWHEIRVENVARAMRCNAEREPPNKDEIYEYTQMMELCRNENTEKVNSMK